MPDLLARKRTHFILWRPATTDPVPVLVIGAADATNQAWREIPLSPVEDHTDLWGIAASDCDLRDDAVYYYWFLVRDTDPYRTGEPYNRLCTDPLATAIDRRVTAPDRPDAAGGEPAGVVRYRGGQLLPCDPGGDLPAWTTDAMPAALAPNTNLVIYELPIRWSHRRSLGSAGLGDGTFRDATALLQEVPEPLAPDLPMFEGQSSYLTALGINALEVLPPADSKTQLGWGYGTANFFAADYYLGHPDPAQPPTATTDLAALVDACHQRGVRFFVDMVMAFAQGCPYRFINFHDFFVQFGVGDPEEAGREGFGGDLWKYNYRLKGYNPIEGDEADLVPARAFMKLYVAHWLDFYRVDGLRLDSVNNINNDEFLEEFSRFARACWRERGGTDDRFVVVGEELSVPLRLVEGRRLDGLWNETFKQIVRQVVLGHQWEGAPDFVESVRRLVDCRRLGFGDVTQAINYLTSHDVGGPGNERFCNWLQNNGVIDAEQRLKLAFTLLLTAVGVPMILAGDEFGQTQELDIAAPDRGDHSKEIDPLDFALLRDDWRQRLFIHVARLIRLRTTSAALAVNDTEFIHSDTEDGRQVLAWQRGQGEDLVIVVANFSDYGTPNPDGDAEYRIGGWPATPAGLRWHEITEDRAVHPDWAGREPVLPWTARVYALVTKDLSDPCA